MKKSLITMLLTAFCFAAFAMEVPQQDTTKVKQHHSKMSKKSSAKKSKAGKKADTTGTGSMNRMGGKDSTMRSTK
jgi:hypothetical protein